MRAAMSSADSGKVGVTGWRGDCPWSPFYLV